MSDTRVLGIEISDLGISAARSGNGDVELVSLDGESKALSGFAQLLDKGEVMFGSAAFRQFLTSDASLENRYWHRLATADPLAGEVKGSKQSPADVDLAHAHLHAVFEKCLPLEGSIAEVVIAVPGHFQASQLGELIQIARQVGMKVSHVLDYSLASLLSAASVPQTDSLLTVDLHWNAVDVTRIKRSENAVERIEVATDRALGLRLLLDRLVDGVGKRFIDECRFDPAARPEYAQELYNQLYAYLSDLADETPRKIETAKGAISVDRQGLALLLESELKSLQQTIVRQSEASSGDLKAAVLLSSRARMLPGLAASLRGAHLPVGTLETGQAALGCLAFRNALNQPSSFDQPLFHTRVEFANATGASHSALKAAAVEGDHYVSGPSGILGPVPATHLLFQGRILELPQAGAPDFVIGKSESITSGLTIIERVEGLADWHLILRRRRDGDLEMVNNGRNTTALNGETVSPNKTMPLQTGDVITLGDPVLQLMIVGLVSADA